MLEKPTITIAAAPAIAPHTAGFVYSGKFTMFLLPRKKIFVGGEIFEK
jgi:hypothetical protein